MQSSFGRADASIACSDRNESSRDVEAEQAALSLARRRGGSAPTVDTKLANAWLGFYVALTKSSGQTSEGTTQSSTDVPTDATFSEVASSVGEEVSPSRAGRQRELWADISEEPEVDDETPNQRSRRARRHRTRGKGKKNRRSEADGDVEDGCSPIDEEEDPASSTSPSRGHGETRAADFSPTALASSPCRAHLTRIGITSTSCTTPYGAPAPASLRRSAAGTSINASPETVPGPSICEASARTPSRVAFGSPATASLHGSVAATSVHALPETVTAPSVCEASARTPPRVAFGGSSTFLTPYNIPSPASHIYTVPSSGTGATLPYFAQVSSPWSAHSPHSPTMALLSPLSAPATPQFFAPPPTPMATSQSADVRSWLAGGTLVSEADLMMRLQAAAPEIYED